MSQEPRDPRGMFSLETTVQQRAFHIEKALAAAVMAIGLGFSSGQARSEDLHDSLPTSSALDAGKTRPIMLKAIVAGGLRPGEVMVLTPRGAERVGPGQVAQHRSLAPNPRASSDACVTF